MAHAVWKHMGMRMNYMGMRMSGATISMVEWAPSRVGRARVREGKTCGMMPEEYAMGDLR